MDDQPTRALSVLVVEDHEDGGDSYRTLLTMLGHRAEVARTCREAEAAVAAFHPDVVLLDVGLPDGDGYDLAERLRALLPRPPVFVAITGMPHQEDRSWQAGFDYHFPKPMDPRVLSDLLRRLADCPG